MQGLQLYLAFMRALQGEKAPCALPLLHLCKGPIQTCPKGTWSISDTVLGTPLSARLFQTPTFQEAEIYPEIVSMHRSIPKPLLAWPEPWCHLKEPLIGV